MSNALATAGRKGLAVLVLVFVAYLTLKFVIGLITSIAWILAAIVALVAVVWAVRTL